MPLKNEPHNFNVLNSESLNSMVASVLPVPIIVVAVIAAVLVAVVWRIRRQHHKQRSVEVAAWLQTLRSMLMHIQRHRGLSCAVLNGHRLMQPKLEEAQTQISRDLAHMARVSENISKNPEWQAITTHWARLAGRHQQLDVLKNLDQHNRLIKGILVFIDELAAESFMGRRGDALPWQQVLRVAEELGQVRAFGLAYLASASTDGRSAPLSKLLQAQVGELEALLSSESSTQLLAEPLLKDIAGFIQAYPKPLLAGAETFDAQEYYQEATQVMDELYVQFDAFLQKLLQRVG